MSSAHRCRAGAWRTRFLVEYARNVAGIIDAQHAEYAPRSGALLITPVACPVPDHAPDGPLLHGAIEVTIVPDSVLGQIVDREVVAEAYTCSYELNPDFQAALTAKGLRITGIDATGAVRAVELADRRFFVATLYQPQQTSAAGRPHPLIVAYLRAALSQR